MASDRRFVETVHFNPKAMSKKLLHTPIADPQRGTIVERLERMEAAYTDMLNKIPGWISNGVLAGTKKMYNEMGPAIYNQLANEHGRVFDVQEKAFMALAEHLHARLCVLEAAAGIASPELEQLRALVDAIAEATGTGEEGTPPADPPEIPEPELVPLASGDYQGVSLTADEANRARGFQ